LVFFLSWDHQHDLLENTAFEERRKKEGKLGVILAYLAVGEGCFFTFRFIMFYLIVFPFSNFSEAPTSKNKN